MEDFHERLLATSIRMHSLYRTALSLCSVKQLGELIEELLPQSITAMDIATACLISETGDIYRRGTELSESDDVFLRQLSWRDLDACFHGKLPSGISFLAAPIRRDAKTLGVLIAANKEVDDFDPTDFQRFQELATITATALENVYAYKTLLEKNERLEEDTQKLQSQMLEQERQARQALEVKNTQLAESYKHLQAAHAKLKRTYDKLRQTQTQLIQSEKMAALGHLASGIAHELNNPIGAIKSNADISYRCLDRIVEALQTCHTLDELEMNQSFQQAIKLLEQNQQITVEISDRIGDIVASLKNFARLDEAAFQKTDIHEGILSALTLLHHRFTNRITIHKALGKIPEIYCYPAQLNQVFMHLIQNAVEAIEGKGRIWLETWQKGGSVKVSIRDNGNGIPPDLLPHIFDPFMTTKPVGQGNGLGLTVSLEIIEQGHNGKIDVESEVNMGTMFVVTLPIQPSGIEKQ